ncbi:MAG: hypothetical protein LBT29_07250 [Flavobacteriaceae bacterium]|nr:hypothetical protein [Flavobacteriaceae bacterium]
MLRVIAGLTRNLCVLPASPRGCNPLSYNFSTVPFTFSLITSMLSKPSLSTTLMAIFVRLPKETATELVIIYRSPYPLWLIICKLIFMLLCKFTNSLFFSGQ